jgi:predicted alpha/beta hydrolase
MTAFAEKFHAGPMDVSLRTQDGTNITARLFKCPGVVRARLVLAGATGVPQTFY